eukprot:Gregarina_sp_Poly_1__11026@NODE_87_length_15225_cov_52_775630_g75_i0_p1_GENE_NODE_87_length_15225_cov_52_775630_g75_i0NODE_87_length_15225_cov_52_775630_g75_i0_p1_ORF_typecomplete_len2037_score289_52Sec7/PF01369_20/2_2e03Sec7/PF01369_20/1_5e62Sec7_N/PF12783_7/8_6e33Sec7_N/PF12783_7/1_3e03DCB/PF16213_5/1_8e08DCB/PF16213_5/2_6e03DCB/PF16213_5/9_2e03_NODE_87_length_15225_cov_52_775630_g75_i0836193
MDSQADTTCHESPVSPLKSVKNEVHNILSILRLTQYVSPRRFSKEILTSHEPPLTRKFQRYLQQLSALDEFEASLATVQPFLDVIRDPYTSGPITGEALGAVNKFVAYNLIRVDRPGAAECINGIADGVINCRFSPSGTPADEVVTLKILNVMIDTLRCPAGDFLDDDNVWAMVKKCYQISRQSRASFLLRSSSENILQQLILKVFASWTAAHRRQHVQTLVASQSVCTIGASEACTTETTKNQARTMGTPYGELTMNRCLQFLAFLTSYGVDHPSKVGHYYPRARNPPAAIAGGTSSPDALPATTSDFLSPPGQGSKGPQHMNSGGGISSYSSSPNVRNIAFGDIRNELRPLGNNFGGLPTQEQDESLKLELRSLGLTLLNVALETGGEIIAQSPELVLVIQEHVCKSLLLNSQTESLFVLSMTLRCIFNLFMYLKKHLKVQLEMFFNSLHLKVASESIQPHPKSNSKRRKDGFLTNFFICEKRELALESLNEFCREPDLILELYENYDCDLRCTNLFQLLVETLGRVADPFTEAAAPLRSVEKQTQQAYQAYQVVVFASKLYRHKPNQPVSLKALAKFTSLNRLAFSGLSAVCKTLAFRCMWDTRGPYIRPGLEEVEDECSANDKLEYLKMQRDWKRRLAQGAQIFNSEPFRCLPALQNLQLLPTPASADAVAEFLRTTPGLDLRLIGEYLAKPGDWAAQVRSAFVSQIDFAGVAVVEALRIFLSSFRLPGEAQQIERILETFAVEYFQQQPTVAEMPVTAPAAESRQVPLSDACRTPRWIPPEGRDRTSFPSQGELASPAARAGKNMPDSYPVPPLRTWWGRRASEPPVEGATIFLSSDTLFVLSYSIIILNTDLHNAQVKKKMSREDFLKNNRGINEGADLPAAYLMSIYSIIKEEELAVVVASSDNSLASLMVENREFWDYLLRNSGSLGDYSSTLAAASVRTPLQTFHHKAMFLILIEDAELIQTLCHVYLATRDPQIVVDCMSTFGDIIRIASFYKVSDVLIDISILLLNFFQPVLSFKSQMVVPILFHLFAIASHQLGYQGWTVYLEFIDRLVACDLVSIAHDSFPVSLRDSQALTKSLGHWIGEQQSPAKIEDLSRLDQRQNSHWFAELTALLFSAGQQPPGDDLSEDGDGVAQQSAESDNEEPEQDAEENSKTNSNAKLSAHQIALHTSLDFWQKCIYFPHELSSESSSRISDILEEVQNSSQNVIEAFRTIIRERCKLDDFFSGRLRSMPLSQCDELFCALATRILMPSPDETQRANCESELKRTQQVDLADIRYVFRRDDAPLLTFDEPELRQFERVIGPASALDHLCKLVLILNQRRDQAHRNESVVVNTNLRRSQSLITPSAEELNGKFFEVYLAVSLLLEKLLMRYSDSSERDPDIREIKVEEMIPNSNSNDAQPTADHFAPTVYIKQLLPKITPVEDAEYTVQNLRFIERVVVMTLKLCLNLGHYSETRILAPLTRLFDLVCRLKAEYLFPLYFQVSSAISILLNPAVYSCGLQKSTTDLLFTIESPESTKVSPPRMPAFYTSILDLIQRMSPWALASGTPHLPEEVRDHLPYQSMSQSGLEILCTMSQSPSFHLTLNQMLRVYPRMHGGGVGGYLPIAHFMRYLVQAYLTYCLPPRPLDISVSAFDLEDSSVGSPVSLETPENQDASDRIIEQTITLFGVLFSGVVCPSIHRMERIEFPDTPSTDDDSEDNALEAGAIWQLWAPVAQALAMLSAFGTRDHRRQALMSLQHHLNSMPLTGEYSASEIAPRQEDACRWSAIIEHVLFPLLSHHFLYPFPVLVTHSQETEHPQRASLGDNLVTLFPARHWVVCKIPRVHLIQNLIEAPHSPLKRMPKQFSMQRKAQSVGFVCRGLLGKLDLFFERSEFKIDPDKYATCLFPSVVRVLRIFLYEMHTANSGTYDAVVEATKNFLLVLATSNQLEAIDDKERDWCLQMLVEQDPRILVPDPKKAKLSSGAAILERYSELFGVYQPELKPSQNRLFTAISYLLDLAGRGEILLSIFDVLVPRAKKHAEIVESPEQ